MSKSKHTPGPWICSTKIGITTVNGKPKVFHKKGPFFCLIDGVDDDTEAAANANLIAAAPDMLAMLEYLHEKIDAKPGTYEFDAVKALIAKARGEK